MINESNHLKLCKSNAYEHAEHHKTKYFRVTLNYLYITLRHRLSHLHFKQIEITQERSEILKNCKRHSLSLLGDLGDEANLLISFPLQVRNRMSLWEMFLLSIIIALRLYRQLIA